MSQIFYLKNDGIKIKETIVEIPVEKVIEKVVFKEEIIRIEKKGPEVIDLQGVIKTISERNRNLTEPPTFFTITNSCPPPFGVSVCYETRRQGVIIDFKEALRSL